MREAGHSRRENGARPAQPNPPVGSGERMPSQLPRPGAAEPAFCTPISISWLWAASRGGEGFSSIWGQGVQERRVTGGHLQPTLTAAVTVGGLGGAPADPWHLAQVWGVATFNQPLRERRKLEV